jgi:hypothetical protein
MATRDVDCHICLARMADQRQIQQEAAEHHLAVERQKRFQYTSQIRKQLYAGNRHDVTNYLANCPKVC